jgi:hypothetical protein
MWERRRGSSPSSHRMSSATFPSSCDVPQALRSIGTTDRFLRHCFFGLNHREDDIASVSVQVFLVRILIFASILYDAKLMLNGYEPAFNEEFLLSSAQKQSLSLVLKLEKCVIFVFFRQATTSASFSCALLSWHARLMKQQHSST